MLNLRFRFCPGCETLNQFYTFVSLLGVHGGLPNWPTCALWISSVSDRQNVLELFASLKLLG